MTTLAPLADTSAKAKSTLEPRPPLWRLGAPLVGLAATLLMFPAPEDDDLPRRIVLVTIATIGALLAARRPGCGQAGLWAAATATAGVALCFQGQMQAGGASALVAGVILLAQGGALAALAGASKPAWWFVLASWTIGALGLLAALYDPLRLSQILGTPYGSGAALMLDLGALPLTLVLTQFGARDGWEHLRRLNAAS